MPTYEYQREDGTRFEVMQRITDDALEKCPTTGQKVKRKIGGGAGLIFKGNGFYVTDYVRKKPPAGEEGASSEGGRSKDKKPGSKKLGSSDSSTSDSSKSSATQGKSNGSESKSNTSTSKND